jgi:hypothetical protein
MVVEFKQKHQNELVGALKKLYGDDGVEVHNEPEKLNMFSRDQKAEPCHIIVRKSTIRKYKDGDYHRPGYNDLGYRKNAKGTYDVYLDTSDVNAKDQGHISQEYGALVAEKELKNKGYTTKRIELPKNEIRIEATRYI